MYQVTEYGKLNVPQLLEHLELVSNSIANNIRELASVTDDYNVEFYNAYARAATNSVAGKEREAEYQCLQLINQKLHLTAELDALNTIRDLIQLILEYRAS